MHAALLANGHVVFLDKVENYTELRLPNGHYAYSSEWDPLSNKLVPLKVQSNPFCSGGIFGADGRLLSIGGNGPLPSIDPTVVDGFKSIRVLPAVDGMNEFSSGWSDNIFQLNSARWYPSVQIMPDGSIFVASGSLNGLDPQNASNNNPTYEILSSNGVPNGMSTPMDILVNTQPYFMYPFIHLLSSGALFVFSSRSSEIFDVASSSTVRKFDDLPGDYRTYPNTGGSVLLPLHSENHYDPDIVVCGGGTFQDISAPTDASCGRIKPFDYNPTWELDAMPEGRVMVEGVLLLDGTVLWINGANQGAQGFGEATSSTLEALIYDPAAPLGQRWTKGASSTIPRLYHSVALLLLDGTVMIAGSNPVEQPVLQPSPADPYVTEFRIEVYTPPYLSKNKTRPSDITMSAQRMTPGSMERLTITFNYPSNSTDVKAVLYYSGFVTHSLHMGHRMIYLDIDRTINNKQRYSVEVTPPPNHNIAPPGPYHVFVLVDGVPGYGQHIMVA